MTTRKVLFFTVAAALFAAAGYAQNTKEPNTVRDYCYKAFPGKAEELLALSHNTMLPLEQAAADAGEFAWKLHAVAVVPAGESAPCDFRVVAGFHGLFPALHSKEKFEAEIKRAGIDTNLDELHAKANSLGRLMNVEYWVALDETGTDLQNGYFVRLNHYKVKLNSGPEWLRLETTFWKPLVDAWNKDGNKGGWGAYRLWMPDGENQPYNALTVDLFSDWNSAAHGIPLNDLWPKAHPRTDRTEVFDRLESVRSRYNTEIYKIVDIVKPKNVTSN